LKTRAVIMAAGKGTRMKSRTPKVLHELCGRSMFEHVLSAVRGAGADEISAIVSPDLKDSIDALGIACIVQEPQNGTGHAMQLAMATLPDDGAQILIASGDMPLVPAELLRQVIAARARSGSPLALVTARVPLPTNFGHVVRAGGVVTKIVEDRDASPEERGIDEVNAAIYCFDGPALRRHLAGLRPNNSQGELYLTDAVAAIVAEGGRIETVEAADRGLVLGINNRVELAAARNAMQRRILDELMLSGVTVIDPSATYVDADVRVGNDTTLLPGTHLRGKTSIGSSCAIGPDSFLENATVGDGVTIWYSAVRDSRIANGVTIGPFAHLRMDSSVEEGARIGDFVELKKTRLGKGAKAQHLAYLGDADVGENANIGAGTITCNWDGKKKNKTKIGRDAFIGSNSSLVAPIEIGDGALTGAGTVVIRDVPAGERVAGNPAKPLKKKGT
jgi:bifunctional UDP-N-acetylglucosamine pyrophosphorylase/glucosamine-1-phosphate N-acetyltransferase